jgi:hypothetical protein
VRNTLVCLVTAAVALTLGACEPASLTDARDQLGRSPADTTRYLLPLTRDTFDVTDLELVGDTIIGDLVAVRVASETARFPVLGDIQIDTVAVSALSISFPPGVFQVPAGTGLDTTASYPALADEPRLQGIDSLRARSGTLHLTTGNRLVEAVDYTVTLAGFRSATGATLTGSGTLPAAPGDGSYTTDVLTFDLAGVTIVPGATSFTVTVSMVVSGSPLNAANAADAIVQGGTADLVVEWLRGPLDPQATPELTRAVECHVEIPVGAVDALGKFKDLIRDVTIESAFGRLRFQNGSGAPVDLSGFTLGVVQLTPTGSVPRDPVTGEPVYETDDLGSPILVPVPGGGQSLLVGRNAQASIDVEMPALVDRMVHLLLDGHRAAIVGAGTATAGDGQQSYLRYTDSVAVAVDAFVGLDVTLPPEGVDYPPQNEINDGLDVGPADVADVLDNLLVGAYATAEVINDTPYELEVVIAYVAGDAGAADVSMLPGAVVLAPVHVAAPQLTSDGRVIAPVVDTVEVAVAPADVEPLLTTTYTTTVKPRFFAGGGGNGRTAFGPESRAVVRATVVVDIKKGGAQ